jgi:hypothetical protein
LVELLLESEPEAQAQAQGLAQAKTQIRAERFHVKIK